MASFAIAEAPALLLKGAGRYPQPVALLARLSMNVGAWASAFSKM